MAQKPNAALKREYTPEEIESVKANLKTAFDIDYIPVEATIKTLNKGVNLDKVEFKKGEQYVFWNPFEDDEHGLSIGYHLIEITYSRLDLIFYKIKTSTKPRTERWACKGSSWVMNLMPCVIELERYNIPDKNMAFIKFEKKKNCPFDISVIKRDGTIEYH